MLIFFSRYNFFYEWGPQGWGLTESAAILADSEQTSSVLNIGPSRRGLKKYEVSIKYWTRCRAHISCPHLSDRELHGPLGGSRTRCVPKGADGTGGSKKYLSFPRVCELQLRSFSPACWPIPNAVECSGFRTRFDAYFSSSFVFSKFYANGWNRCNLVVVSMTQCLLFFFFLFSNVFVGLFLK